MKFRFLLLMSSLSATAQVATTIKEAPLLSAAHEAFLENLRALCGKAFVGKVVADQPKSEGFIYRFIRVAREFRVDFDLTQPVEVPRVPWGYAD